MFPSLIPRIFGTPTPPREQTQLSLTNTVNTLGLNILSHTLSLKPTKSAGLCALNITHCLSLLAAGSKDKNLAALAQVLNFTPQSLDAMITNILSLDSYSKSSSAVDMSSASAIFPRKDFILKEPWKKLILEQFKAEIGPLELGPINGFIERETKGKLKDVVKAGDIAQAVMVLVTCLYFKAKWANPFERSRTMVNETFYGFEREMKCDLMYKYDRMEYVETSKCQVVVLPYQSGDTGPKWKAVVVLPKGKGVGAMRDLIASLSASPDALTKLLVGSSGPSAKVNTGHSGGRPSRGGMGNVPSGRQEKVYLYLPRFSLRLNLDLIPSLSELGLKPIFSPSSDFAPISAGPLMINKATHDLFIEVNEEGTEMAAATVMVMT